MQSERIAPLRNRIAQLAPITREILTTLEPEDMHMDDLPPAVGERLDWKDRPFRLKCPGCAELAKFPQSLLARQVQCRGCGHKFRAEWGEPVAVNAAPMRRELAGVRAGGVSEFDEERNHEHAN